MQSLRATAYNERKLETCPAHCLSHFTVNQNRQKLVPRAPSLGLGVGGAFWREVPATRGGEAMQQAEVILLLYLKTSLHSRAAGSHQRPSSVVRQSKKPRSFPELVTCSASREKAAARRPMAAKAGTEPAAARAARACWSKPSPRSAQARRLTPPPAPPTRLHALSSPPLPLPACGTATAGAGALGPRPRGGAGRGGRGRASPPQDSAQQRRVETLGR